MYKSYEEIKEAILNEIQLDKREGSFISDMVSPISIEIESAYEKMKRLLGTFFLLDASKEDLEKRASEYGLFRKPGTKSNGLLTVNGINGAFIQKGSLFSTSNGLLFKTLTNTEILESSVTIAVESDDIGSKYNVIANSIVEIPVAIQGVASCTNQNIMLDGTDFESDDSLLIRILLKLRSPSTSGNPSHYKEWALEVAGVGDTKILPLWNGNGTVKVLIVTSEKRAPSQLLIDDVVSNIENKRPIGALVTVLAPLEVGINIVANVSFDETITLANVIDIFTTKLMTYIENSVFKNKNVDYYKCLSLFYEIEGVIEVVGLTLNGGTSTILIADEEIQVVGTILIT